MDYVRITLAKDNSVYQTSPQSNKDLRRGSKSLKQILSSFAEGNSNITCYQCSTLRLDRSLIISSPKLSRALLIDPTITSPAKTCSENGKIRLQPFTERYPNPTRGLIQETSTRENWIIDQQITVENVLSLTPNITAVEQGPEEGKQVPETDTVVLRRR